MQNEQQNLSPAEKLAARKAARAARQALGSKGFTKGAASPEAVAAAKAEAAPKPLPKPKPASVEPAYASESGKVLEGAAADHYILSDERPRLTPFQYNGEWRWSLTPAEYAALKTSKGSNFLTHHAAYTSAGRFLSWSRNDLLDQARCLRSNRGRIAAGFRRAGQEPPAEAAQWAAYVPAHKRAEAAAWDTKVAELKA